MNPDDYDEDDARALWLNQALTVNLINRLEKRCEGARKTVESCVRANDHTGATKAIGHLDAFTKALEDIRRG